MTDQSQAARSPRLYTELNDVSGWCCLLVVLGHILSPGVTGAARGTWQFALVYLLQLFTLASVPGFLFLSGAKLGMAHSRGSVLPYPTYLKHRAAKVYLPYLAWTVLYYVVFTAIGYAQGTVGELVHHLLHASLSAQFYYVLAVMQFYLLRPLWHWMGDHVIWQLGMPLALVVTLTAPQVQRVCAEHWPSVFQYGGRLVLYYVFYLVAGVYAGERYEDFKKLLSKLFGTWWGVAFSVCITLSHLILSYRSAMGRPPIFIHRIIKPVFSLVMVALLVYWAIVSADCGPKRRRLRQFLNRASLFVFFAHCLVLILGDIVLRRLGVTRLGAFLVCRGLLAYAVSFGGWMVLHQLRIRVQKLHR